ncbi:uncharacterized protein B0P05DRAFT_551608, partial [Gilbertella persicaria]|uniref:uncharacterized protein n=1 Tax=Gilbertella persicaria TaxID=101096 RepID=UPI00221F3951
MHDKINNFRRYVLYINWAYKHRTVPRSEHNKYFILTKISIVSSLYNGEVVVLMIDIMQIFFI